MEKLLLTPAEAAEALSVGRTAFYAMIKRGEVPGVIRFGTSIRISADILREWIRQQVAESAG